MIKVCPSCKQDKSFSEFYKNKSRKNGISPYCKNCSKKWRIDNLDKAKGYKRKWYLANTDKAKKIVKAYRFSHANKINEANKKRFKKASVTLSNKYVKLVLANVLGIPFRLVTDELVEMKREQIKAFRAYKQIKKEITR